MLLCECLSVLAGHCVVWLSDSHSLKVRLFVSNLFATPALAQSMHFPMLYARGGEHAALDT